MFFYFIRRLLYIIPILVGVNVLTFLLFFIINPPQDQARKALGGKNINASQITRYLHEKGYDLPRFYNEKEVGLGNQLKNTIFYHKFIRLFILDLGVSDSDGHDIAREVSRRIGPSLFLSIPSLILSLILTLFLSILAAYFQGSRFDRSIAAISVLLMSISVLFYIIGLQFLLGRYLKWIPISGWSDNIDVWRFAIGSVLISMIAGLGGGLRFYRSIFLEEMQKEYLRTARAKGLSEFKLLLKHILPNALIPVVTSVVSGLPFLIMGSMLLESFFAIPGLGNYTLDGLDNKDFAVVRSMVFLGTILTLIGLLLTDIAYRLVDPRVTFETGVSQKNSKSNIWFVFGFVLIFIIGLMLIGHLTDPLKHGLTDQTFTQNIETISLSSKSSFSPLLGVLMNNLIVLLILSVLIYCLYLFKITQAYPKFLKSVRESKIIFCSIVIFSIYFFLATLDSFVLRDPIVSTNAKSNTYQVKTISLLDLLFLKYWQVTQNSSSNSPIRSLNDIWEKSYSSPLSTSLAVKTTNPTTGMRTYEKLKYPYGHLFGTDKAGVDSFYRTLKGIRTAMVIGLLTTLIALPFALVFGLLAGFYGSWVDDAVQYVYTTLSAIPGVLLIMAFILIFGPGLFQICIILGITGWVELCRLIRGETLKMRELTFIQAAKSLGSSNFSIIFKHLLPNLSHIILISLVLSFSGLVLSEATLSYLGIGVDGSTGSWGNMINDARMELSREPLVWWPLACSFTFMFLLILPANILSDKIQEILNPKSNH